MIKRKITKVKVKSQLSLWLQRIIRENQIHFQSLMIKQRNTTKNTYLLMESLNKMPGLHQKNISPSEPGCTPNFIETFAYSTFSHKLFPSHSTNTCIWTSCHKPNSMEVDEILSMLEKLHWPPFSIRLYSSQPVKYQYFQKKWQGVGIWRKRYPSACV